MCRVGPVTSRQIDHQYSMYHHCAGRSGSHSVVDVHHLDANRRIRVTRRTATIPASLPVRARNAGAAETVPCQRHADSRPMHRYSDHPVRHIRCGHAALTLYEPRILRRTIDKRYRTTNLSNMSAPRTVTVHGADIDPTIRSSRRWCRMSRSRPAIRPVSGPDADRIRPWLTW